MIAVRLQGGLGNQLFQYAAGRTLADRLGRDLGLDVRDCVDPPPGNTPRPYLLGRYPVRARVLGAWSMFWNGLPRSPRWRRAFGRTGLFRGSVLREEGPGFRAGLEHEARAGSVAYLDGYWQSWRYFQSHRGVLVGELRPKREARGRNADLLRRIAGKKAICVHVRRGDYVSLAAAAEVHGLMGADYYRAAVKRLGASARGGVFYVFSDEPAWARRRLPLPGRKVVVGHNGVEEPEEDLRLMAACRHFIIANSSLSWWGAWLGQSRGKRVVAPRRWFKAGPATPDLCPPDWMRL